MRTNQEHWRILGASVIIDRPIARTPSWTPTCVLFVAKKKRAIVRSSLTPAVLGDISLRERKTLAGSEFYFAGPSTQARHAHATAAKTLQTSELIG